MSRKLSKHLYTRALALSSLTALGLGSAGCGDDVATVDYGYEDYYLYDSYYPADVAYAGAYWADDWAYDGLYLAQVSTTDGGAGGDGGVIVADGGADAGAGGTGGTSDAGAGGAGGTGGSGSSRLSTVGDLVRALARGQSVCPGQVTVTPKTAPPACAGDVRAAVRAGATIVFNGCQIPNAGTVSGTVDVTSTRTASAAICDASTSITLSFTTTITNLSYTAPNGAKLVIPTQTDMGMATFTLGQTPPSLAISTDGQLQIFGTAGSVVSDHDYTASRTFKFAGSSSGYTVDGTANITDNKTAGVSTALTATGLARSSSCCRPVGGTLKVVRTGSVRPGTHTWTFGPSCGAAMYDNKSATLPACI